MLNGAQLIILSTNIEVQNDIANFIFDWLFIESLVNCFKNILATIFYIATTVDFYRTPQHSACGKIFTDMIYTYLHTNRFDTRDTELYKINNRYLYFQFREKPTSIEGAKFTFPPAFTNRVNFQQTSLSSMAKTFAIFVPCTIVSCVTMPIFVVVGLFSAIGVFSKWLIDEVKSLLRNETLEKPTKKNWFRSRSRNVVRHSTLILAYFLAFIAFPVIVASGGYYVHLTEMAHDVLIDPTRTYIKGFFN